MTIQWTSIAERLRQPYPNSVPAILLALIIPGYHVIVMYPRDAIAEKDRLLAPRRALRAVWLCATIVAFLWAYRFAGTL